MQVSYILLLGQRFFTSEGSIPSNKKLKELLKIGGVDMILTRPTPDPERGSRVSLIGTLKNIEDK